LLNFPLGVLKQEWVIVIGLEQQQQHTTTGTTGTTTRKKKTAPVFPGTFRVGHLRYSLYLFSQSILNVDAATVFPLGPKDMSPRIRLLTVTL